MMFHIQSAQATKDIYLKKYAFEQTNTSAAFRFDSWIPFRTDSGKAYCLWPGPSKIPLWGEGPGFLMIKKATTGTK